MAAARATLVDTRRQRPAPYLDDKVLTSWNGLMVRTGRGLMVVASTPGASSWVLCSAYRTRWGTAAAVVVPLMTIRGRRQDPLLATFYPFLVLWPLEGPRIYRTYGTHAHKNLYI